MVDPECYGHLILQSMIEARYMLLASTSLRLVGLAAITQASRRLLLVRSCSICQMPRMPVARVTGVLDGTLTLSLSLAR